MGWQSFNSDISNQTSASSASLEMLLNERQGDPEEMLLSLGFGGQPQGYVPALARVPERFLHHPSRAYGISAPGPGEEVEGDVEEDPPSGTSGGGGGQATSATLPPTKKRTGIWTLARTLSLFRTRSNPSPVGHVSPSGTPGGTPPLANEILSILHPVNQRYLASRGYYQKAGWLKGTFLEADEKYQVAREEEEARDAASRRRIYQKTRTRGNWSMCGSGDEENEAPSDNGEWVTKSMDDSLSRDGLTGRDDSLGRETHFSSTTTESSTDSLDDNNAETERAFREIRRQYNESRRREWSSSEDVFLPQRKKRLSGDVAEQDEQDGDKDLLTADRGTNYFISPANSRQATVEKQPTISDASTGVNLTEDGDKNDGNNNPNRNSLFKRNNSDVRIIVSTSETSMGKSLNNRKELRGISPCKLTVASSDSGSSSSTSTAVGSNNVQTTADDTDTLRLSESEYSVTDGDSISRTHSPYGFSLKSMVTSSCQTADSDFKLAAALGSGLGAGNAVRLDKRGKDYENPRVQLSALPTAINPIELMRRLQHSQDELSRMGSIQSDSSGFGDADPVVDSGSHDYNNLKVASMGSSSESCGTLASSATTAILRDPPRGEMATQTSIDFSQGKLSRNVTHVGDDKSSIKQSPRPSSEEARYVTVCYIPSLNARSGQSEGLRRRGTVAGDGATIKTVRSTFISDFASPQRPRGDSEPALDFSQRVQLMEDDHSYARFPGNRDAWTTGFRGYGRPHNDPRWRVNEESPRKYLNRHHSDYYLQNYIEKHRQHEYTSSHVNDAPLMAGTSDRDRTRRTYRSHINLYASEKGLQRGEVSHCSHTPATQPRRHSDERILEGRNNKPLSVELALAIGADNKISLASSSASSFVTSVTTTATSVPMSSSITTTSNSNVISSTSIYIQSRPTPTTSLTTPAHYKTEAGFHFPPLAGNISSLQADQHSTPMDPSTRPLRSMSSRQRSCDILEDDFSDGDPIAAPVSDTDMQNRSANLQQHSAPEHFTSSILKRFPTSWHESSNTVLSHADSVPNPSYYRTFDDMETYSSIAESSSDFSFQSSPEASAKAGIMDSRKLAKLINQPIYFKGTRRYGSHYQPRHLFKEWSLLSKRKRLQEENRLLQHAIQKYKTELSIMETSFMVDFQAAFAEMTDLEREDAEELQWLWREVKGQVLELEQELMARVKSVYAGNDFFSFMSSMGIINKTIELIKEQIYQQQITNSRAGGRKEIFMDEDDVDLFHDNSSYSNRTGSMHSARNWMTDAGPQRFRRYQSSSTSNLPSDLNISLEKMKSSLLSQVKQEIRENTKRLEEDLQAKDKEIKELKEHLSKSFDAVEKASHRWTPKPAGSRSRSVVEGQRSSTRTRSRSRVVGNRIVQETDV